MDDTIQVEAGDTVWIDEGDNAGCFEFSGVVKRVNADGTIDVRVTSHPIGYGVAHNTVRRTHAECVYEVTKP